MEGDLSGLYRVSGIGRYSITKTLAILIIEEILKKIKTVNIFGIVRQNLSSQKGRYIQT